MLNPKNICICACIGFFLSFLIGLFSGVRFSYVLLRAFLFALLFAVLYVAVFFLYQKFLSTETSNSFGEPESTVTRKSPAQNGSVINIVVDDSNLPDDGMSPKFNVSQNHTPPISQDLPPKTESPVPPVNQPAESVNEPAPFKPMGLETVASSANAPAASATNVTSDSSDSSDSEPEKLDELPDMGTLDAMASDSDDGNGSIENSADVVDDTEFATGGKPMREQPISGDTNVMAKAIQTLLAKDNS